MHVYSRGGRRSGLGFSDQFQLIQVASYFCKVKLLVMLSAKPDHFKRFAMIWVVSLNVILGATH